MLRSPRFEIGIGVFCSFSLISLNFASNCELQSWANRISRANMRRRASKRVEWNCVCGCCSLLGKRYTFDGKTALECPEEAALPCAQYRAADGTYVIAPGLFLLPSPEKPGENRKKERTKGRGVLNSKKKKL